jgi:hypothetical protein
MPTLQSHTFASRTSRHTSQSLQKSVPVPTQEEFQNIFSFLSKKIKQPTRRPTRQRHGNSITTMVYRHGGQERQLVTWVWRHAG